MKIGFTGTRNGLSDAQRGTLGTVLLLDVKPTEFRHGSCRGADVEAARLVFYIWDQCRIICHPGPDDDPCRESSGVDTEILPGKTHFARNRDIVNATELLIGCPGVMEWQKRGGTFYTLDFCLKQKKPVKIIWPDGTLEERK